MEKIDAQEQGRVYAGFWIRTGATLIDTVLVILITWPILIFVYGWAYFDGTKTGFIAGPIDFLISWVMPTIIVILFWLKKQATPGKTAVSLKVVDARTGKTMSVAQSIGRYFAYVVSFLPLGLGFLWVAFDKKKQGWHDKLAGTVVIKSKRGNSSQVHFE
ncbi:MAG: RDD family protein [Gallionella sp.]|nr:RDD family protein [Gallionella sp.]